MFRRVGGVDAGYPRVRAVLAQLLDDWAVGVVGEPGVGGEGKVDDDRAEGDAAHQHLLPARHGNDRRAQNGHENYQGYEAVEGLHRLARASPHDVPGHDQHRANG